MSISRTLVILALAAAPATLMAQQPPAMTMAGEAPFTFRPTAEKDTLWTIVAETVPLGPQVSVNQAMVAIRRQNPNAFVFGNLHVLRKGVVLTIPSLAQIKAEDRIKSGAVIEQHLRLLVEGVKERAPLYEIKPLPATPTPAASAPAQPASAAPVRPPAARAVPPMRAASRSPERAAAASAPASAAAPRPVVPAASAAVSAPAAASAAASAVASVPAVAASAASMVPAARASQPAAPASAVAAKPAVPVASEPASSPAEPAVPDGNAAYLTYLAAGAALLGVALWAWRRRAGSPAVADQAFVEEAESSGPRLVQVSTAAVDTARSVDAMKPVLELVRNDSAANLPAYQDVSSQATLNLQVARAYVELRRFDEAYVLLQYVVQNGSPEQQQEAQTLLRGSS
jgi:FimV-like protein